LIRILDLATENGVRLLHLADSGLPTGGFAFSSGLEAAAKLRLIRTRSDLVEWVDGALGQVADGELLFMVAFCRQTDAETVLDAYHAWTTTSSIRAGQLRQGRALLRLLKHLHGEAAIAGSVRFFLSQSDRTYFPAVFGMTLAEIGHEAEELALLYLYLGLRDGISAAIRIGLVGPLEGHRIQHRHLQTCAKLVFNSSGKTWRDARKTAPLLEIAQGYHERLYTKLFQN
jgi:urease accessory protein